MPVYKKVLCLIFFSIFSLSLFATIPPDSVGVKIVQGKKFILHKVEVKDYWYSVARRYQVNPIALQKANPKVQGDLKIGNVIMVPVEEKVFLMPPVKETVSVKPQKETPVAKTEVAAKKEEKTVPSVSKPESKDASIVNVPKATVAKPKDVKPVAAVVPDAKVQPNKEEKKQASTPIQKEVKETTPIKKTEVESKVQGNIVASASVRAAQGKGKFPLIHAVKAGETIFSISQQYSISLSDLIGWNNLVSDELKPAQQLVVGFGSNEQTNTASVKKEIESSSVSPAETIASEKNIPATIKEGKALKNPVPVAKAEPKADPSVQEINERGIASWINDKEINPSKFYALHRTASVGTIIKVTNTMNNKDVFVKVVGSLPDTGDNNNVLIKISKAAVEKIDAIDQKFQVVLSYGEPR